MVSSAGCEETDFHGWVAAHAHELTRGGLWMTGREPGRPDPGGFDAAALKLLVVRLSSYGDTALSQSHGLVAALFRAAGDKLGRPVFADLAFLPPHPDAALLQKFNWPLLFGTGTGRPARAFDVLALSCSHASEFLNLPWLLAGSEIPLSLSERMRQPDIPWILLGGAAACHTSPLHGDAAGPDSGGLVDGVIMGDGEAMIPQLVEFLTASSAGDFDRACTRKRMAECVPGFYDPTATTQQFASEGKGPLIKVSSRDDRDPLRFERAPAVPLPDHDPPDTWFIPYDAEAMGIATLALSRGCPCFCAYCREGWENRPYRERDLTALQRAMATAKAACGADTFHPAAFNFDMHTALFPLLETAGKLFNHVKPKSERFDLLAARPETAKVTVRLGKRSFTLGLEGISQRLIDYLGKQIDTTQVLQAVDHLGRCGAGELKVFLIVTGLEEEPDFEAFNRLLDGMMHASRQSGSKGMKMIFSASPLIVQPHTPMQFLPSGVTPRRFEAVCARLRDLIPKHGATFRTSARMDEINVLQLLNTGDRRLTRPLVRVSIAGKHLYRRSITRDTEDALYAALREAGVDPASMLEDRKPDLAHPWSDIASGVDPDFLRRRFEDARDGKPGQDCLDRPGRPGRCLKCGVSGDQDCIRPAPNSAPPPPDTNWEEIRRTRRNPLAYTLEVEASDALRFVDRNFFPRAAARCLMLEEPRFIQAYIGPGGVHPGPERRIAGLLSVTLLFRRDTEPDLLDRLLDPGFLKAASRHARDIALLSGHSGTSSDSAPETERYLLLLPKNTDQVVLDAAITRPKKGAPLPLQKVRRGEEIHYLPAGKKARQCPVRFARIREDDRGELTVYLEVKPRFDPGAVAAIIRPRAPMRVVVRRLPPVEADSVEVDSA